MPDWFYRTISRPVLFHLPASLGRDLTLRFMGGLARLPLGPSVIDFLGHMAPDERLGRTHFGIYFPTAIGLGPGIDSRAIALPALARFGLGFIEVGPVAPAAYKDDHEVLRDIDGQSIRSHSARRIACDDALVDRLRELHEVATPCPLIVRLDDSCDARESLDLIERLVPWTDIFSTTAVSNALTQGLAPEQLQARLRTMLDVLDHRWPLLLCCPSDVDLGRALPLIEIGIREGIAGIIVDGMVATPNGELLQGTPARELSLAVVRQLRSQLNPELGIIAGGGVHEPGDALNLMAAGADLVQIDTGLVYSGPGLPKRINESLFHGLVEGDAADTRPARLVELTWFWAALLGAGMLFGAILALLIATTRVVLPYDEAFLGIRLAQIQSINPRLLAFMTHDRVSLAGTMVALGGMYLGLAIFGIRSGQAWAWHAIQLSALTGFASFFLFLGFGYLDTFHAFVAAILFQIVLMAIHSRIEPDSFRGVLQLTSNRAWRCSLWGQLLLIIHGAGLLVAGAVIAVIGATGVFVPEDLHFLGTTGDALRTANDHLVPLVAHDRATLGGMLLSSGWVFMCSALWGFRAGQSWLWWLTLVSGLSAYLLATAVHLSVGYTDLGHLVPVLAGPTLLLAGLALSRDYLCART